MKDLEDEPLPYEDALLVYELAGLRQKFWLEVAELLLPEVAVPLYDCTDLLAPVEGTYDEEDPEPLLPDGLEAVVLSVDTMPVLYPEETLLTEDEEDSDEPVPLVPFEEPVLTEVRLAVDELVPMPLRFTGVRVVPSVLTFEL